MAQAHNPAESEDVRSGTHRSQAVIVYGFNPRAQYTWAGGGQSVELHMGPAAELGPNFWTHQLDVNHQSSTVSDVGFLSEDIAFNLAYPQPRSEPNRRYGMQDDYGQSLNTSSRFSSDYSLATQEWIMTPPRYLGIDTGDEMDMGSNSGAGLDFGPGFEAGLFDDNQVFDIELNGHNTASRFKPCVPDLGGLEDMTNGHARFKAEDSWNPDTHLIFGPGDGAVPQEHSMPEKGPDAKVKNHQCDFCSTSFVRAGDRDRHRRTHFPENRLHHCHENGCSRNGANAFFRRDKLRDHQRKVHGGGENVDIF